LVTPTFVQVRASEVGGWDGGEAVVSEFEDEDAAGPEVRGGLRDEIGVEFVASSPP